MQVGLELKGRFVFFATNNVNKFNEARQVLAPSRIAVGMLRIKSLEIQSESLEEIAGASVQEAFQRYRLPIVVEDAGLFVEALNGFPGPYAAYVYKTIGNEGILRLMEKLDNRKATFKSVIAYFSSKLNSPICFEGSAKGEIVHKERKSAGKEEFGFDPIFKPDNTDKTFAQMNIAEKCKRSHRAAAFRKFAEWYK
jgi:XTP/dITP diphosphohydrolase